MNPDETIGRWSWKYAIVKFLAKSAFYIFYRRVYVNGLENVPGGGGLIFAANHQNALMDALAVLLTGKYQPVYLARADIFRNSLAACILKFLKIMPVYRLRDGVESMGQNEDTFEKTTTVLAAGGCIGIMPEGNHSEMKRLRTLKKGIFRIAFKAIETPEDSPDIKIIPVGLDFSNTSGVFEELVVNYGKPLPVSGYKDLYKLHPQKGINAMRADLSESLQQLMIDIRDEANYDEDNLLMELGSPFLIKKLSGRSHRSSKRFLASRAFCQAMYEYYDLYPDRAGRLRTKSGTLSGVLKKYGIQPFAAEKKGNTAFILEFLGRVICFPFFIAGFALHILPWSLIHIFLRKLNDSQFISSFKFGLGFLLVPLNYAFLGVLLFYYLPMLYAALILGAVPFAGFLGYICRRSSQRFTERMHFRRICKSDKEVADTIELLKKGIITELEPILNLAEEKLK